ncbi:glycoside hydrolase family 5 protein [Parasediminibacterium sp. JCM 36343]|uniref:glycoside hydrolase family 5 protein n=1 Tax=Parasediminibacterium sp. JCM 36343 TaxID=3374279 RepID=UPI00397A4567
MFNKHTLLLFVAILCISIVSGQDKPSNIGVVLCGAEFGEKKLPGNLYTDYIYPNKQEIDYFVAKGFTQFTLPFKWERVQRTLGGDLDSAEVARMKEFLASCNNNHIKVILTLQNFAVYNNNSKELTLGSRKLSRDLYKDFWKKMATAFSGCTNIYGYDIMNEPRNIFGRKWRKAAQAAIDGIREADMSTSIIIDGENGSFAFDWPSENNKLRKLKDPADKIIYDAHCYFDFNHSGQYDNNYQTDFKTDIGIDRVKPFIKWLKKHNKQGIIGEFGVPPSDKWLEAMDKFVAYLQKNGLGANYWAAGPWWGDYALSIEPANNTDRPQMKVLGKYLKPVVITP